MKPSISPTTIVNGSKLGRRKRRSTTFCFWPMTLWLMRWRMMRRAEHIAECAHHE
jgi:hypothetical protein